MFQTIRAKFILILLAFVTITIIASFIAFKYVAENKDRLSQITRQIESVYILMLEDIKVSRDFFAYETINSTFFETGESDYLIKHKLICKELDSTLHSLDESQKQNHFGLDADIKKLTNDLLHYKALSDTITKQIIKRGFKDFGIEGQMRYYGHLLENYDTEIGRANLLQLRRHEKDFIIRQENQYIHKFKDQLNAIKINVLQNNRIKKNKKNEINSVLDKYALEFMCLTEFDKKIGLKNQQGLKKQIDETVKHMEVYFMSMLNTAANQEKLNFKDLKGRYIAFWVAYILIALFSALYVSKKISITITLLKEKISDFIKSDFTKRTVLPKYNSSNEVDILVNNFGIMEQHIVNQMNALKHTNKELETIFYRASHEIKDPLTSLKKATERALTKTTDPEMIKSISMISKSCEKLIDIVDELGIITDIKTEEVNSEVIDFESELMSIYRDFQFLPGFDSVIFSIKMNLQEPFHSDPEIIKTIFRQLIENSIKYKDLSKSSCFIKVSISQERKGLVKIDFSDNGVGIKKEYHSKIFEMFFRGTHLSTGTGLGLYVFKNSLQRLNGAVTVESEEGVGTTLTILLPDNSKKKKLVERIIQKEEFLTSTQQNTMLNYM